MIHELKTLPEYFEVVRNGRKNFELRQNDRKFKIGDFLALNEWDKEYTGRSELVEITYIINPNDIMPCQEGYVIIAFKRWYSFDS